MADEDQLRILRQGVETWNKWREEHPDRCVDLSEADLFSASLRGAHLVATDLSGANLSRADLWHADLNGTNLSGANLSLASLWQADLNGANLSGADLWHADLGGANFGGANLDRASLQAATLDDTTVIDAKWRLVWEISSQSAANRDLRGADFSRANLREAMLSGANLWRANLSEADLTQANLSRANLSEADLREANLEGALLLNTVLNGADLTACRVCGVSAWGIRLENAIQKDLIITPAGEPAITVDNLEVAQFIYLLLNNARIRAVINTITTKAVLILGRFTPERKAVLDAMRERLRLSNYLPIVFDFDPTATRDLTETVTTLARLSRFIIADLTEPRSIPQELESIVPHLPSVPVVPLLAGAGAEYGMFAHFKRYPWVLAIQRYRDLDDLLASLQDQVIAPAEAKAKELAGT
jgi:uncharacterized protein YjbI with pentapeptide repeats